MLFVVYRILARYPSTIFTVLCLECDTGDIVFLVDSSGSIKDNGEGNWDLIKMFLKDVIARSSAGNDEHRFAVVIFSDIVRIEVDLDDNDNILDDIDDMELIGSKTNTPLAINDMLDEVLVEAAGDRRDVANVVIFITDGEVNDEYRAALPDALERLRDSQAKVVGKKCNNIIK